MTTKTNKERAREWIEQVDEDDYETYAFMVMRSLRGSWTDPQVRIHILDELCDEGIFDEEIREEIETRIERFKLDYFDSWHDGRTFRRLYQELDGERDMTPSRETAERLAVNIPNDFTYDEREFEKIEEYHAGDRDISPAGQHPDHKDDE